MFNTSKAVISISRDKINACLVDLFPPYNVKELVKLDWTPENLSVVLKQIKDKLKTNQIRLLLSGDLSYVMDVTIPADTKETEERQTVATSVGTEIPEILDNEDWDYKVVSQDKKQKKLIVFAPVKDKFTLISQAFASLKMEIEAVEPEDVAKTRHENPVVGLALKQDLKGKDEEVLNLKLSVTQSTPNPKISSKNRKSPIILFIVVLSFIIIATVIFFRQVQTKPTAEPVVTPTPVASITPSLEASLNLSEYLVQILNGSGIAGQAGAVQTLLTAKGFNKFTLGNAKLYNYTDTEISLKANIADDVFKAISDILENDYTVVKSAPSLSQNSTYDVVITVGRKK